MCKLAALDQVDDTGGVTHQQGHEARARALHRRHKLADRVDYLTLIREMANNDRSCRRRRPAVEGAGERSWIAFVIALSQMSRECEKGPDKGCG